VLFDISILCPIRPKDFIGLPTRIAVPMKEHEVNGSSSRIKHVCKIKNAISEFIVGDRGNAVAASAVVVAANRWAMTTSLLRPPKLALTALALIDTAPAYKTAKSSGINVGLSTRSALGRLCVLSGNHDQKLRHSLAKVGTWIKGIIGLTPSRKLRNRISQCFFDGIEWRMERTSFALLLLDSRPDLSKARNKPMPLSSSGEGELLECGGLERPQGGLLDDVVSDLFVLLRTWFNSVICDGKSQYRAEYQAGMG
jgi:hypothetical protein